MLPGPKLQSSATALSVFTFRRSHTEAMVQYIEGISRIWNMVQLSICCRHTRTCCACLYTIQEPCSQFEMVRVGLHELHPFLCKLFLRSVPFVAVRRHPVDSQMAISANQDTSGRSLPAEALVPWDAAVGMIPQRGGMI